MANLKEETYAPTLVEILEQKSIPLLTKANEEAMAAYNAKIMNLGKKKNFKVYNF